jgi:hypothetical protein
MSVCTKFIHIFETNISNQFQIFFKPQFATQFSHHILSNVFDQSFHISVVFQNRHFNLFFFCRVTNEVRVRV